MKINQLSYDSVFILLPDSTANPEGIEFLSKLSSLDIYMIQIKLKSRLPVVLFRCNRKDISGGVSDKIESLGIDFLVIDKKLYGESFNALMVRECRFEQTNCRFILQKNQPLDISQRSDVLLLEAVYRTNISDTFAPVKYDSFEGELYEKKGGSVSANDVKIIRSILLYKKQDSVPLCLADSLIDYTFLEFEKDITATANFNILKKKLENTFKQKINADMVQFANGIEQLTVADKRIEQLSKKKRRQQSIKKTSNEESVNLMSRLFYYKWCNEKGWINRIVN